VVSSNNYLKIGKRFIFFNDRNRIERINALGFCQSHRGAVVYRRPDPLWDNVKAVGDGIGALDKIPEESEAA
jgi:hypothetical protein